LGFEDSRATQLRVGPYKGRTLAEGDLFGGWGGGIVRIFFLEAAHEKAAGGGPKGSSPRRDFWRPGVYDPQDARAGMRRARSGFSGGNHFAGNLAPQMDLPPVKLGGTGTRTARSACRTGRPRLFGPLGSGRSATHGPRLRGEKPRCQPFFWAGGQFWGRLSGDTRWTACWARGEGPTHIFLRCVSEKGPVDHLSANPFSEIEKAQPKVKNPVGDRELQLLAKTS